MPNYDKEIELLAANPRDFSPVVIIGKTGNGKSTFLENFCKRRNELYKPALSEGKDGENLKIFNARELFESLVESISAGNPSAWRENFVDHDIIIIDDFDTVAYKSTTQEELLSYFLVCNKAIIIATKSEIREPDFSAELSSFFFSCAHIYIDDPDKESKIDFLTNQLTTNGLLVEDDALLWLAVQNFASYASIKGFIKTLKLFKKNSAYTLEDCKRLVKGYIIEEG